MEVQAEGQVVEVSPVTPVIQDLQVPTVQPRQVLALIFRGAKRVLQVLQGQAVSEAMPVVAVPLEQCTFVALLLLLRLEGRGVPEAVVRAMVIPALHPLLEVGEVEERG
jgi:hypothetical protein